VAGLLAAKQVVALKALSWFSRLERHLGMPLLEQEQIRLKVIYVPYPKSEDRTSLLIQIIDIHCNDPYTIRSVQFEEVCEGAVTILQSSSASMIISDRAKEAPARVTPHTSIKL